MKSKILLTLTFAIVLGSCAPMLISTPTETPVPTKTLTPVPPSPTATPTITPSPTETPDPNRPSDAMGKDINGYYKEVQENGKTIRYYWVELNYGDNIEKSIYKGWFASHIINGDANGSIPLYNLTDKNKMVPFYYYVQQGKQTPYIKSLGTFNNKFIDGKVNIVFSDEFEHKLMRAYSGRNWWQVPRDKFIQFENDFWGGKISFSFSTPTGDYTWKLTQTTGYKFYAIKWDDADPATHPGFYETRNGNISSRWTIYTDKDGNLIAIGAEKLKDATDAENILYQEDPSGDFFLSEIFLPMSQILELNKLPEKIKYFQNRYGMVLFVNYAVRSECQKVMQSGPDPKYNKQVDLCYVPQFEIVQNP